MSFLEIARRVLADRQAGNELNETDEQSAPVPATEPGLNSSISFLSSSPSPIVPIDPKLLASLEEWNRQARDRAKRKRSPPGAHSQTPTA